MSRDVRAYVLRVPERVATITAARRAAARALIALAHANGLPRDVARGDVARIVGRGRDRGDGRIARVPTIAQLRVPRMVHVGRMIAPAKGPLAGSIVVLLDVAHPMIAPHLGRSLPVPATWNGRAVPGGAGNVPIPALAAFETRGPDHDGIEESP